MRSGVQAFFAGFFVPAIAFILLSALLIPQGTFYFFRLYPLHYLPVFWGIWNVLYYYVGRHIIILKKIGIWGALLGLSMSSISVFLFNSIELFKKYLFIEVSIKNIIITEVIVYAVIWEIFVRIINNLLID